MKLPDAEQCVDDLLEQIGLAIDAKQMHDPVLIGIHTGGFWVAERLAAGLSLAEPGAVDIGFHRDDHHASLSRLSEPRQVQPSDIRHDLEGREVILVDDVLHTGRTIRAAINLLFEYGRPACVRLAVLMSRAGRQLPIAPDWCAVTLDETFTGRIKLSGPTPMTWQTHAHVA